MNDMLDFEQLYKDNNYEVDICYGPTIKIEEFIGKRFAVLGKTGSGKTVSAARLAEQAIKGGMQVVVFDVEDDYSTLNQIQQERVLVFSDGFTDDKIKYIVDMVLEYPVSIIFNLRSYFQNERDSIMVAFLSLLWDRIDKNKLKLGMLIMVDEAHKIIPQSRPSNMQLLIFIEQIAKQGRKRGVGLMIISQRPSEVQKNVLAQCDHKFFHRVDSPNDIDAYGEMLNFRGRSSSENRERVQDAIMKLAKGQCFYQYPTNIPGDKGFKLIKIKFRESIHPGSTPGLEVLYPI